MALLTLKDIGKIYVSEGNVAVGIRGVNLSFDRGEFVAVTGKSGSGKSTLLNVISGMDTYEEGELFIEEQSTSHYLQADWESYRQKYISFIFQDYNIMESYTVLQNVELSLMHIPDARERRRRALELIERVGLTSHAKHKGSKLSGGQKQRTVIARALAKDSPIILADEPTGNLDSKSSEEIIQLLREVSQDKLVIVVTHNYDEVAHCATRHVRIYDGAVESDHETDNKRNVSPAPQEKPEKVAAPVPKKAKKASSLRLGFTLGRTVFTSRPRLSAFMCLLLTVGTLGIFLITSFSGSAGDLFDQTTMFRPIDGRLVLTAQNGAPLTEEELQSLAQKYGATGYLHYDILLDQSSAFIMNGNRFLTLRYTYGESYGEQIVGRYPQSANEVLLRLPLSCRPTYGKDEILEPYITLEGLEYEVVGLSYFYDNNEQGKILLTEQGFRTLTAAHCVLGRAQYSLQVTLLNADSGVSQTLKGFSCVPTFEMETGKLYIKSKDYQAAQKKALLENPSARLQTEVSLLSSFYSYNYYWINAEQTKVFSKIYTDADLTKTEPLKKTGGLQNSTSGDFYYYNDTVVEEKVPVSGDTVYIHTDVLTALAEEYLAQSYRQASLFFENDRAALAAAQEINRSGYRSVLSSTAYTPDPLDTITETLLAIGVAIIWFACVLFLAFFVRLCSNRSLEAFKGDLAILRSMGIPVKIIRIGMYIRMLLCLIPAFAFVIVVAFLVFTTPVFNGFFTYLYAWQYALIFLGMLLLCYFVTRKQLRRLFGESVKKALKGEENA